jgi:hypothetical protein
MMCGGPFIIVHEAGMERGKKDEKGGEIRSIISSERGVYVPYGVTAQVTRI